ncbi:MAG TPA: hypothetical protein VFU21_23635 [Kofleriaceae bacterium]|nr:hypothetical protein [Kofleriaceae bacterium]
MKRLRIRITTSRLLRLAAMLSMVGLCFMVWSLLDPRPIPIMAAMSVGQGIGMLSFAIFLGVVIFDAWRASKRAPPPPDEEGG